MRLAAKIVGVLLFLIGVIWTLQGVSVLQGSPMSGQSFWAIVGVVLIVMGAILAYLGWRRDKPLSS